MGFLAGIFGGGNGLNFNAQQYANLQQPYNGQQVQDQLAQYQQLVNALGGQNGIGNQSNVYNQLQNVANGQGPNPAQAMLSQATGANVSNQAALMAGQRGASANPGLIARQASMQGGNLQQQAVGQGATMQANQSLNALGQLGGLASQQVAQQTNAQGNLLGAAQQGLANQNQNQVSLAGVQGQTDQQQAQAQGGLLGGVGRFLGPVLGAALGGPLGGAVTGALAPPQQKAMGGVIEDEDCSISDHLMGRGGKVPSKASSKVPAYVSPGELIKHTDGKTERVPGKARVSGDSYKNDTVHKNLEPGAIVIPRSHSSDPEKAAEFARRVALRNKRPTK